MLRGQRNPLSMFIRTFRPRVELAQTTAMFCVVETKTTVVNTLLVNAICNLAKPGILGCIVRT